MNELTPYEQKGLFLVRWWAKVREAGSTVASAGGTILTVALALSIFFSQQHGWLAVWHVIVVAILAVATQVAGMVLQRKHQDSIVTLQRKLQSIEVTHNQDDELRRSAIESKAYELIRECKVLNDHTRMTVYQHEPQRKTFVRLSRVSDNPLLTEPGRSEYPDHQGQIHETWTKGTTSKLRLPDDPQEWAEEVSFSGIPTDVALSIKMKSRSLVGVRVDYKEHKVGVLIMESSNPQGVSNTHADKLKEHSAFRELAGMLAVTPKLPPLDD